MPNENKNLSAEEIAQHVIDVRYHNSKFEKMSSFELYHFIVDSIKQFHAEKDAEIKRLEFEAMERRADLQDLENENSYLLSQTEKQSINNNYEALKLLQASKNTIYFLDALEEKEGIVNKDLMLQLTEAITNYEKQE